jgi:uncharacterized protein (DUF1800 family)
MKMPLRQFRRLRKAIHSLGGLKPEATERERWDMFWRAHDTKSFDARDCFALMDAEIDTALRRIASGRPWSGSL